MANKNATDGLPPIKVVGVGGGGCNAVNRMIEARVAGVEFVGINADAQALVGCQAESRLRIGERLTRGLGVGGDALQGQRRRGEPREIVDAIRGRRHDFHCRRNGRWHRHRRRAGHGRGRPRKRAPSRSAVVTKPFAFEGARRRQQAEDGVSHLRDRVDTLIVIPNDRLLAICDQKTTVIEAFKVADDVLRQGIQGISELITTPGDINVDFADVRASCAKPAPR